MRTANFVPSQDVFGEIGCLYEEHHNQIEENATPVVHPPRRVPYALQVIWASDFSQSVHRKSPPNKNPYRAAARACKLKNP